VSACLNIGVGSRFGHWTVVRVLAPQRPPAGTRPQPLYEVSAECSGWLKVIAQKNLVHNIHADTCVRCAPRRIKKPRPVRPPKPRSNRGRFDSLHRCQVQMPSGMGQPHICGALHQPRDFAEHLRGHGIETDDMAAAFGPALNSKEWA
jgi:hypothetical protein